MGHGPQAISSRALSQLEVPFRLHGRSPGVALDCVGLVAMAIEPYLDGRSVPQHYALRGDFLNRICDFLPPCHSGRKLSVAHQLLEIFCWPKSGHLNST